MIKNAPYKFTEFESFSYQFGPRQSMLNSYNSKTGEYQYVNDRDSVVKTQLKLNKDDLLYLHRKAASLGFWDFPVNEIGDSIKTGRQPLRYIIEFKYQRKSKRVTFDQNYDNDPKLIDANVKMIKEIELVMAQAEGRQKK
ncbi:hypothetical protein ACFQZS_02510 [Mucilaginibacter calamicampi]|uniref:Uncharacterized protein n=1 Tax=Mucilaginibacter calamicampi TaxID=1302352 RepID=A0ABW2YX16_9SPHI